MTSSVMDGTTIGRSGKQVDGSIRNTQVPMEVLIQYSGTLHGKIGRNIEPGVLVEQQQQRLSHPIPSPLLPFL